MSKYSFEQYQTVFNGVVQENKDKPFYRALIDRFGIPRWPQEALECALLGVRRAGKLETTAKTSRMEENGLIPLLQGTSLLISTTHHRSQYQP